MLRPRRRGGAGAGYDEASATPVQTGGSCIAAVLGSLLIARIGARGALLVGLIVIGVSSALRGVGPSARSSQR